MFSKLPILGKLNTAHSNYWGEVYSHSIVINFAHAAIIGTINSAIQLHIRRLKGLGMPCRSQQSCRHMIHGRVRQVGGNKLTR